MTLTNIRFGDAEHTTILAERDGVAFSVPYEAVEQQLRDPETDALTGVTVMTSGNRDMMEILDVTLNADPPVEITAFDPGPLSIADVEAEQARRLAEGFDYDFGDARGVHHIGTTEKDMKGWDEVTKIAQALLNAGMGSTEISIWTNTGAVEVTALEWQSILLAAGQFRQPIFQGAFWLLTQDPIPADYATNEAYWE